MYTLEKFLKVLSLILFQEEHEHRNTRNKNHSSTVLERLVSKSYIQETNNFPPNSSFTIAYISMVPVGTNGTDRVNAPVYHREDNKQEYANITNDLCLRPPSRRDNVLEASWNSLSGPGPSIPNGKRDYSRNHTMQRAGGRDGDRRKEGSDCVIVPGNPGIL